MNNSFFSLAETVTTSNIFLDLRKAANETYIPHMPLPLLRDHNPFAETEGRSRKPKVIRADPILSALVSQVVIIPCHSFQR